MAKVKKAVLSPEAYQFICEYITIMTERFGVPVKVLQAINSCKVVDVEDMPVKDNPDKTIKK